MYYVDIMYFMYICRERERERERESERAVVFWLDAIINYLYCICQFIMKSLESCSCLEIWIAIKEVEYIHIYIYIYI